MTNPAEHSYPTPLRQVRHIDRQFDHQVRSRTLLRQLHSDREITQRSLQKPTPPSNANAETNAVA